MTVSRRRSVLVDGHWLERNLEDPRLIILEVDERPRIYRLGHVPGAYCLDWRTELQHPIARDLPDATAMTRLWQRVGVRAESTVVFYGDRSNWYACFGFWLFRLYGASDLRLLDGGRQAWLVEERPLTLEEPAPSRVPATAIARPRRARRLRATREDVLNSSRDRAQLLDVRTPAEYRGDVLTEPGYPFEAAQRPGHIPGARSVPWEFAIDGDGRLLDDERLRAGLTARGVDLARPAITYCRIGERSAHTWFVLHELLGIRARNYDGSWTEWGNMIGMPVALGEQP